MYIYTVYIILYIYVYNYDDIYIYPLMTGTALPSGHSNCWECVKKNWPVEFPKNGDMTIPQNTWTLMVVQLVKQITRVI